MLQQVAVALRRNDPKIEALQGQVAPFVILRGVEVNIKADGTLDMADELLAELDWVVASVHAAREKNPLERVFATMENPYVDCIGHLTGRKLNKRGPVDIDIERVIEKALETKTFLELNSQPDRLDLREHRQVADALQVRRCPLQRRRPVAPEIYWRFLSFSICFHVRVFTTSAFVSHARRAWPTPNST